jgi:sugar phosphate isomerase/epimerase
MKIPIGLQLYSVRAECQKDLAGTLAEVARMGYRAVEPWGYDGTTLSWMGHDAAEIRKMLRGNRLACCGIHLRTEALVGVNLGRTIELNRTLGNRFLIVASDKERMASTQGITELAHILDAAADFVRVAGMFVGYHSHGFDFATVEGKPAWELLFTRTRPEVIMQLDVGNCAGGGGDPIATLRRFPWRARTVHLKEHGGSPGSVIGEGALDWAEIFRLCETTQGTEWYVLEEGSADGAGFDIPRRSLEALRRMGKVKGGAR